MDASSATIMVVDDDIRNTRLLDAQLRGEGYETMLAESGEEALEQLKTRLPDLILLDIMMPGLSGFDVAGRLKLDERTKNIPIIMVTALDDRDSRLHALHMGAEEFLNKPVDRAELWIRVRNLLRLKEYQNLLADHNRRLEGQVSERTAQLREAYKDTIYTMVRAAEFKTRKPARMCSASATTVATWQKIWGSNGLSSKRFSTPARCTTSARSPFPTRSC